MFQKLEGGMRIMNWARLGTCTFILTLGGSVRAQPPSTQPSSQANPQQLVESALKGAGLSEAQANALEEKVKGEPDDADSRAQLLWYYFNKQITQPATIEARRAHVLWMIHNRPADHFTGSPPCSIEFEIDPVGYAAAKELWEQQAVNTPRSAAVLGNAAAFMRMHDPADAEDLLKRAESADPTDPHWPEDLAEFAELHLRLSSASQPGDPLDRARFVLGEYEKAYALSKTPEERFYHLTPLPKAAFACGDNAKATDYARQLLVQAENFKRDWNYGNAIHVANLTLGRIALASGDVETAKARLLDAGKTPGSPQLDSFGPNMELAHELLQKGEKDVVLQYFDLCAKFWTMGGASLDSWRQTVKAGGTPDFGPSLNY
jgi:tetratricopeptide (TPR) repeat protein